jgi:hypothetical protein
LDADCITNQIQILKGLGHAFANPSGANYAPEQTADRADKQYPQSVGAASSNIAIARDTRKIKEYGKKNIAY